MQMTSDQAYSALIERISPLVEALYPNEDAVALAHKFAAKTGVDKANCAMPVSHQSHWNEQDVMLITYGDSIINDSEKPLKTLKRTLDNFLKERRYAV